MSNDRKAFVASAFKKNPEIKAVDLSRSVREKFGKGIGFVEIKKLREACGEGTFDRVWDELMGMDDEWQACQSTLPAESRKKSRGERRHKMALRGRRSVDRNKILLKEFRGHLVVYRGKDGFLNAQQFDSRKRAEDLVKELLGEGLREADIAWFRRSEMGSRAAA